ncbi:MAG TPA: ribose 5-phosphate isomerase B [Hydrogenispora sp.]|jgi:ribose 5-phosphate isomerase B|nr:ribose 5-phosphate isomerase B [Hydrogenispora sp.]
MVRNILFVCTGNTCRSPMAAALLRQLLNERGGKFKNIRVSSAGLYAQPGAPASPEAVETMRGYGVDLSNHLARELAREELAAADLILTMTNAQKNQIIKIFPGVKDRTYVLREYIKAKSPAGKDQWDVPDPFGQPLVVYQKCAAALEKDLRAFIDLLASEAEAGGAEQQKGGEKMRIALGADHAGFHLKEEIAKYLQSSGYEYKDFGVFSTDSVDYPDQAAIVAKAVAKKEFDQGIIICGTGIGVAISANKVKGVRAALCHDVFSARMARAHNDSNVLTLGARVVGTGLALSIVEAYLTGEFAGGRHQQRVDKIMRLEKE